MEAPTMMTRVRRLLLATLLVAEAFALLFLAVHLSNFQVRKVREGETYYLDGVQHRLATPATPATPSTSSLTRENRFPIIRDNVAREMKHLLKSFALACGEHGLVFWASGGTLLGALRHGGIIPWDDDADVHMLRSALPVLRSDAFEATLSSMCLCASKLLFGRQDVLKIGRCGARPLLDVFFVDEVDGVWGRCATSVDDPTCGVVDPAKKEVFASLDALFPLVEVPFEDMTIPVPREALTFVERQYGAGAMREMAPAHVHSWDVVSVPRIRMQRKRRRWLT